MAALRRIFKLCDTNKDGILDASELNEFQVIFFWFPSWLLFADLVFVSGSVSMPPFSFRNLRVLRTWSKKTFRGEFKMAVSRRQVSYTYILPSFNGDGWRLHGQYYGNLVMERICDLLNRSYTQSMLIVCLIELF